MPSLASQDRDFLCSPGGSWRVHDQPLPLRHAGTRSRRETRPASAVPYLPAGCRWRRPDRAPAADADRQRGAAGGPRRGHLGRRPGDDLRAAAIVLFAGPRQPQRPLRTPPRPGPGDARLRPQLSASGVGRQPLDAVPRSRAGRAHRRQRGHRDGLRGGPRHARAAHPALRLAVRRPRPGHDPRPRSRWAAGDARHDAAAVAGRRPVPAQRPARRPVPRGNPAPDATPPPGSEADERLALDQRPGSATGGRTPAGGACPGIPRLAGGDGGLALLRDREVSLEQRLDRLLAGPLRRARGARPDPRREPLQAAPGRRPPAAPGPRPARLRPAAVRPGRLVILAGLRAAALRARQPRHPGHAGAALGPRAGRSPGRVAGRAEQPDEPRRDRRSAADERPVPLGQRSARASALAGAPFLAGALLVLVGLVLAWQLRPTGEERSWTG